MSKVKTFKIGDKLAWTSQAAGTPLEKVGTVVAVIPPNLNPPVKAVSYRYGASEVAFGWGASRKQESYLVLVSYPGTKRVPKLYWPRVQGLRKVGVNNRIIKT
jgi:hypothetical protein